RELKGSKFACRDKCPSPPDTPVTGKNSRETGCGRAPGQNSAAHRGYVARLKLPEAITVTSAQPTRPTEPSKRLAPGRGGQGRPQASLADAPEVVLHPVHERDRN